MINDFPSFFQNRDMSYNKLSGTIPLEIGNLICLQELQDFS